MKFLFITFMLLSFGYGHSQAIDSSKVIKYKSSIIRLQTRTKENAEWTTKDFLLNGLIVIDVNKRKITTYSDKKDDDLDFISYNHEKIKSIDRYTWKCVDNRNEECTAILEFLDGTPFLFKIEYIYFKAWYFLDE